MRKLKSSYLLPVTGASIALILSTTGCGSASSGDGSGSTQSAPAAISTVQAHGYSEYDTSDIRILMARATHVFTGKVLSQSGTKELSAHPETQFSVQTGIAIKGEVAETVTVNQGAGIKQGLGVFVSINDDDPLAVGQWYRFATRIHPGEGWYTAIPVHGTVAITEQEALDESSGPITEAITALEENPQGRLNLPPTTPAEPPLTFPIPQPGDDNPPPPSPPQPTP